jgi:2-polyprenyl-3-methyl-5-hydroxy-6-metoxy-1,4-benzoquinol methylase
MKEVRSDPALLQRRAETLRPWRYDHQIGDFRIRGDAVTAPVHGSLGRGADIMRHLLCAIAATSDVSHMRAIDLGCLEGHYTELLCEAGFGEVVGVDLSPSHVERARFLLTEAHGHDRVRIIEGSVEDDALLRSLGRFDVIVFHGLLYHMVDPIGMIERLRRLGADGQVLLLSTQFKFRFVEMVAPWPAANIYRRDADARMTQLVGNLDGSVYKAVAMRLNPAALDLLLRINGYGEIVGYDTPLGSRVGFHANLVAGGRDPVALRRALERPSGIPMLRFYDWTGDRLDRYRLDRVPQAIVMRLALRAFSSIGEIVGGPRIRLALRRLVRLARS